MKFRKESLNSEELNICENRLLDEWASCVSGFVRDGVVNHKKYCGASVKLLFVLKEVNGNAVKDLRERLREGGRNQTWNVVSRWTEGILNLEKDYIWEELSENNDERRKEYLQYICAINMKKTAGKDVADNSKIYESATNNSEKLKEQILLYKPDIVICCGTDSAYTHVMGVKPEWKITAHGIWYYIEPAGTIVVAYSHPEARIKECMLHYALIEAIKDIIENN